MRIALAQINPVIGDLKGNSEAIISACRKAVSANSDIVVTPELSLWGYPPRDLLLNPFLIKKQKELIENICESIKSIYPNIILLIGFAELANDNKKPNLFNSIAMIDKSGWKVIARKQLLPSYDVFDEKRYFREGEPSGNFKCKIKGKHYNIGITICEDLWVEDNILDQLLVGPDPISKFENKNLDILINISASPYSINKESLRNKLALSAVKRLQCPVAYINQVGSNDELIFDGSSFVINSNSKLELLMPHCREDIGIWDINKQNKVIDYEWNINLKEKLFEALVLGVKDYGKKCGFNSALIGLSGGIDSALVAVIACAAFSPRKVSSLLMPSPWSSAGSVHDAISLAKRINIQADIIGIEQIMNTFNTTLSSSLDCKLESTSAENLQSRIRGTLLMAIANQQGHLLLSTGNKSELAVGYCTLYGDMNGGLAVIGDLYKTCIFDLCKWLDSKDSYRARERFCLPINCELIGSKILKKPPSAELSPGQLDTDSLPEYSILDPILKELIEKKSSSEDLINNGYEPHLIRKIQRLIKKAEFKRRQAPPLLKVTDQAFGSGWRVPIAAI